MEIGIEQNVLAKSMIARYVAVADCIKSLISIILGIGYGVILDWTIALRLW